MALKDDIKLLSSVPLFSSMSGEQMKLIAFGAERVHLGDNDVLFHPGEPADCAYLVANGRIALMQTNRFGENSIVASAGAGTLLSELAMISDIDRKYTAVARQETELLRITRVLFHRLLEEYPEVGATIEARIRENFLALAAQVEAVHYKFV